MRYIFIVLIIVLLSTVVNASSELKITDLDIWVDNEKSSTDESGGLIDDVLPGSMIKIKLRIDNLFGEDSGIDINEITAEATIFGIDDGKSLYDSDSGFDLDSGDHETINLEIKIPLEVEYGKYDMVVDVYGTSDNGDFLEDKIELVLKIEKEKHDVLIRNPSIIPSSLKCGQYAELRAELVNLGKESEDVVFILRNDDLDISEKRLVELDDDPFDPESSFPLFIPIYIDKDVRAGKYYLSLEAYFSGESRKITLPLNIDCQEKKGDEVLPSGTTVTSKIIYPPKLQTTFLHEINSDNLTAILIIFIILLEIFIILFLVGLFAKSPKKYTKKNYKIKEYY